MSAEGQHICTCSLWPFLHTVIPLAWQTSSPRLQLQRQPLSHGALPVLSLLTPLYAASQQPCVFVLCRVGLDVFEDEPKMKSGLAECDNAVIVPHIASASFWTRSAMVRTGQTHLNKPCAQWVS